MARESLVVAEPFDEARANAGRVQSGGPIAACRASDRSAAHAIRACGSGAKARSNKPSSDAGNAGRAARTGRGFRRKLALVAAASASGKGNVPVSNSYATTDAE